MRDRSAPQCSADSATIRTSDTGPTTSSSNGPATTSVDRSLAHQEMSESNEIEADRDDETRFSYTCPICLCEYAAIRKKEGPDSDSDSEETNQATDNEYQLVYSPENRIPIFTLAATCQHKYCAPCLHAYAQSKLVGGDMEISCCHFHPTASDERDVGRCNVALAKCDIERLIHMEYFRRNSYVSDWINTAQDCNRAASDELWKKYKKLEFDRLHDKDAVRRCPTCDEASLFDVNAMKRYQTKFESISTESATSGVSAGARASFDRFFGIIRQTQDSNNTTPAYNVSSGADGNQAAEEDEEQPTVLEPEGGLHSEESASEQIAEISLVKSKSPVITCSSCSSEFCYFHSNAHQGQSCLAYHAATSAADRTNAEFATRVLRAKPCPNCGISVSKEGGCNQMKCSSCSTHFCWLCGTIVDDGPFPDHFRWWNLSGCPNMQLDESTEPMRCTLVGARVISVLQLLILGVPAVALSIVSMLICPCMVPGCGSNMRERVINCVSFWGSCLSTIIMLPFTCLGMLLVASLYCFVAAISLCFKIPRNNDGTSRQRGNQPVIRAPAENETAQQSSATEELIRELENIFGRMEEGTLHEGVDLASATRDSIEYLNTVDL